MRLEIERSAEHYLITSHLKLQSLSLSAPYPDNKPFKYLIFHSEMFSSLCQIPYQSHSSSHLFALADWLTDSTVSIAAPQVKVRDHENTTQ